MKKSIVLVTGGMGFIGSRVVEELVSYGENVLVCDTAATPSYYWARLEAHSAVELLVADICDPETYKQIEKRFKVKGIIHLAAIHYIPYCNEYPDEVMRVNVHGTSLVANLAKEFHLPLVYISSAAVYCNSHNISYYESHQLCEDDADVYSLSKIKAEKIISDLPNPYAIVRLFNIYGEHDPHEHLVPKLVQHAVSKEKELYLGSRYSVRDYIYVHDAAKAIVALYKRVSKSNEQLVTDINTRVGTSVESLVDMVLTAYSSNEMNAERPTVIYNSSEHTREKEIPKLISNSQRPHISQFIDWSPLLVSEGIEMMLERKTLL